MWKDVIMQTMGKGSVLDKAGQEVTQATPTCIDPLASASRVLGLEGHTTTSGLFCNLLNLRKFTWSPYSPKSDITKATKQREAFLKSVLKGHSALLW